MSSFEITGGARLNGEIIPQGAKNEALQVICACLLTPEKVTIHNVPDIRDVNRLIELLAAMGVQVSKPGKSSVTLKAEEINFDFLRTKEFRDKAGTLRGSIMVLGPMLARFGKGFVYIPGGDKIGRRRLDTHFLGLQKLGAEFEYHRDEQLFSVAATDLRGDYMLLDEASVTGTANILMAAVMAKGTTTIFNAACEPYISQLCNMLVSMGSKIEGIGSNLLKITGERR